MLAGLMPTNVVAAEIDECTAAAQDALGQEWTDIKAEATYVVGECRDSVDVSAVTACEMAITSGINYYRSTSDYGGAVDIVTEGCTGIPLCTDLGCDGSDPILGECPDGETGKVVLGVEACIRDLDPCGGNPCTEPCPNGETGKVILGFEACAGDPCGEDGCGGVPVTSIAGDVDMTMACTLENFPSEGGGDLSCGTISAIQRGAGNAMIYGTTTAGNYYQFAMQLPATDGSLSLSGSHHEICHGIAGQDGVEIAGSGSAEMDEMVAIVSPFGASLGKVGNEEQFDFNFASNGQSTAAFVATGGSARFYTPTSQQVAIGQVGFSGTITVERVLPTPGAALNCLTPGNATFIIHLVASSPA